MRILVTGSAEGLGRAAAATLLTAGHDVVVHVRSEARREAVADLLDRGARVVVGDLASIDETRQVVEQANTLGRMDAVIHNGGVFSGASVIPVNVVAPYLLTVGLLRPDRLVYLSSDMHRSGHADLDRIDWAGTRPGDYSASKLLVTTLAMTVARRWPQVLSNAVDPGWVPTRMGGPSAPDDLRLGHLTQEWLATSDDPRALTSGGYWHHQQRARPHPTTMDEAFQDRLLDALSRFTGRPLGTRPRPGEVL